MNDDSRTMPPMARDPGITQEMIEAGRRLALARRAVGMTQVEVCDRLEILPNTWNGYEKGKRMPDPFHMARFANITGATLEWIYRGRIETLPVAMAAKIEQLSRKLA